MDSQHKNADYIDCRNYLSESADVIEQIEVDDQKLKGELGEISSFLRVRLETLCLITVPCEPPCEESDVGDKNPCLCGGD